MEKEFVPYNLALELKELGFEEPCFGYYVPLLDDTQELEIKLIETHGKKITLAPTFSQCFKWFREKYQKNIVIFSDGYQWTFDLRWVDGDSLDNYPIIQFPRREVGREWFDTYEEAELECLKKLIEIVKDGENR